MKSKIKKNYRRFRDSSRNFTRKFRTNESIFTEIYKKNLWGGESKSGPGSDLIQTENLRKELPELFKKLRLTSILDVPCGDFNWMKKVNLDFLSYIGADIVEELIIANNKKYSTSNKKFVKLDISKDKLPKVDLILCRDALFHFSHDDIFKTIENFKKSNSTYLLSSSHLLSKKNQNIVTGGWTHLNLLNPPFNFPTPLEIIHEGDFGNEKLDKSLLLWKISDI